MTNQHDPWWKGTSFDTVAVTDRSSSQLAFEGG
jgi:hypothetical protein